VQKAELLLKPLLRNPSMFEAITAFFVVLSVGILFAHTLDALRS
jgi:hypothetical protein